MKTIEFKCSECGAVISLKHFNDEELVLIGAHKECMLAKVEEI